MTQTQSQSAAHYCIACECLVNSKIPLSLFPKLETRLRRHLQSKATASSTTFSATSDQLELIRDDEVLAATIESLKIVEDELEAAATDKLDKIVKVFLYKYPTIEDDQNGPRKLNITNSSLEGDDSSTFYSLEAFPNASCQDLWDSLLFDSSVKMAILSYLTAIFRFTLAGLTEKNEISFNRILLLYGPPGTGKSTLARALIFKLSTRLYHLQKPTTFLKDKDSSDSSSSSTSSSDNLPLYDRLICLTLNSSQLFSRFFSESSKSVQKVFERVGELARQAGNFVCVLVDEVESLAMSRKHSADSGSSEPTDSIRAVNTLLTQIDQLRSLPNILYITTSNYPSLVDSAFMDRVDWSFEVSLPSEKVIYALLVGSVRAMRAKGLIKGADELANSAQAAQLIGGQSAELLTICTSLKGQSGRAVKRLPLMAYAAFLKNHPNSHNITIPQFIQSLKDLIINK